MTEEQQRRLDSAKEWLRIFPFPRHNPTDDAIWMDAWRIVNSPPEDWPPDWVIRDP